jgi:hypothetical protein
VQFCWTSIACVKTNCASEVFGIAQKSVKNLVGASGIVSPSGEEAKRTICRFDSCQDAKFPFAFALSATRSARRPCISFCKLYKLAATFVAAFVMRSKLPTRAWAARYFEGKEEAQSFAAALDVDSKVVLTSAWKTGYLVVVQRKFKARR